MAGRKAIGIRRDQALKRIEAGIDAIRKDMGVKPADVKVEKQLGNRTTDPLLKHVKQLESIASLVENIGRQSAKLKKKEESESVAKPE